MKVIAAMAREHQIFLQMINRLEAALSLPEEAARLEIRESLLVFLPALDKHEEIEDFVFADPDYASSEGAEKIRAELANEHRRVDRLRGEIRGMLEDADCPWERFKDRISVAAPEIRRHFELEEKRLWPHYAKAMSRSRDSTAAHRVDLEVRRLSDEVKKNRLSVADYLEGRR